VIDHQQGTSNPLDQLRDAHEVFLDVLSNVRPEQMSLPTPDDEWDVRALINHVVLVLSVRRAVSPTRPRPPVGRPRVDHAALSNAFPGAASRFGGVASAANGLAPAEPA
jgi:Mycothiol maleylpyruvate isomerase N-terminal domain